MIENMGQLTQQLMASGLSESDAKKMALQVSEYQKKLSPEPCWQRIQKDILAKDTSNHFAVHQLLYKTVYPDWDKMPAPAWFPDDHFIQTTHIGKWMKKLRLTEYKDFHRWSVEHYPAFWEEVIRQLNIIFDEPYQQIVDLSAGVTSPKWLPGARLNIANSCFKADKKTVAIIEQSEQGDLKKTTYEQLNHLSNRIANSVRQHFQTGDRIAIIMPMTTEAVAIYLGIVKAGCSVISIADSFAADEIAVRATIAGAKAVFTQDEIIRDGKRLPLYEKIKEANAPLIITIPVMDTLRQPLRQQDMSWHHFLSDNNGFTAVSVTPETYTNILFSSGTTGTPKAIPWSHITPIKCGSDAYLHHNIQPGDVLCWYTNLGWMMGPWLIYASFLNDATIALYNGMPVGKHFGKFIEHAKVNMLGVVPTLVRSWRTSRCMEKLDWRSIKLFSSTGECSNIDDMLYLMSLAHYKPVMEYCGGTEIGGAYITGTLVQPSAPAAFTTPTLGLDFVIIDEKGKPAQNGEVALVPPSIGLSTELLNKDHYKVYYADMPTLASGQPLRRHGDQVEQFANGYYRLHGRVDDTMNLGGIKISSTEIESVLNALAMLHETAAIAVNPPGGGPSQLVIYAVLKPEEKISIDQLKLLMQNAIKERLNPLFKIQDVVLIEALPRTASNKLMRRVLRDQYKKN